MIKGVVRHTVLFAAMAGWALAMPGMQSKPDAEMGSLPAGHPDIADHSATTLPTEAIGQLTVRVVNRTSGAAIQPDSPVVVHLHGHGQQPCSEYQAKLDAAGVAVIEKISLSDAPLHPDISVQHGQITYQVQGPAMSRTKPQASIELPVYEATDQPLEWRIQMRHLLLEQVADGVRVMEMVVAENPGDRTWIGVPHDGHNHRATVSFWIPNGAKNVELGEGFVEGQVHNEGKVLSSSAPLMPGATRFQYAYVLPAIDGEVKLPVVAPVQTSHLMAFVPDDGTTVAADGLIPRPPKEGIKARSYMAMGLATGQTVSLTIAGLPKVAAATGNMPKIVAGVGIVLVLVLGSAIILLKPRAAAK